MSISGDPESADGACKVASYSLGEHLEERTFRAPVKVMNISDQPIGPEGQGTISEATDDGHRPVLMSAQSGFADKIGPADPPQ